MGEPVRLGMVGGLDLMTVKAVVKPGTLKECLNYEVATRDGYSRVRGIERFDGRASVGSYKLWRLRVSALAEEAANWTAGNEIYFEIGVSGYILLAREASNGDTVLYVIMPGGAATPALPATLTNVTTTATCSPYRRDVVFRAYGTQATFDAALKAITDAQRAEVTPVPGRPGSDVIGLFGFKDRQYAVRDLRRVAFENGYFTDANEGEYVVLEDGLSYQILGVTITGERQGILTLDTEAGAGTLATALVEATLTELPVTGSLEDGYTTIPYADGLSVSGGVPPYEWTVDGQEGTANDPITSPDANAINFLPHITDAALYRSTDDGWERVPLGREMAFKQGRAPLGNFIRSALLTGAVVKDTGYVFPTSSKFNEVATAAPNADDGTLVNLTGASGDRLMCSGFGFNTLIPDGATIVGIEVVVERRSSVGAEAMDAVVDLIGIEGGTDNKADGLPWPSALAAQTYGGETDLWGSQYINADRVRTTNFGARVLVKRASSGVAATGAIDYVKMKVWYVEKDVTLYVRNAGATAPSDVEVTFRHAQILNGNLTDQSADGWMTIDADMHSDKTRLISMGDQIRTGPNGTGDLLAYVAARDRPLWLSGQAEVDNNRSRYQFFETNYYGQDEFSAIYGVSGAGPAFCFDGERFIYIRTQLPRNFDLPRHVFRHGDMLGLGYFSGALIFSVPGNPFEMRSEEGAAAVEVGDRLAAVLPFAGDALGIICQASTFGLRGLTADNFFKATVSDKRGGIEYTAVNMGRVILCDGLGVFHADTPESFGAIQRNYISQLVHPWLEPRLQAATNAENAYLRPITALTVRSKNQMRLYFWDGWVLTMTATEPPQFTTQRYFSPASDDDSEPTPWAVRAVCSWIDSSGRERLFGSFYGGIKEGYVFELDSGRSFDGDPIPATLLLNPVTASKSSTLKRHDRLFAFGLAHGTAALSASRSVNDLDPDPSKATASTLGAPGDAAATTLSPARMSIDRPAEGYDLTLRFDSNSDSEGEHVVQMIELYVDGRGNSRGDAGERG